MGDKMTTLEPCPFCGGEAEITWEACDLPGFDGKSWSASCRGNVDEDCFASNYAQFKRREYAIQAWNKRTRHLSQPAERGDAVAYRYWDATCWMYSQRPLPGSKAEPLYPAPPPAAGVPDVKEMVNRFLSWRLPSDFRPDGGISFTHVTDPAWSHDTWPTGTNLFHAGQAEQMIRHMLSATPSPTIDVAAVRGAVKAVPWTSDPTVVCLILDDGTQCNVYPESRVNETDVDEQQYFLEALARAIGDAK